MTNYLGIDYGLSHLGLALAESNLATPLPSLNNNERLLSHLSVLVSKQAVTTIVCGLPEGKLVEVIKKFAADLEQTTDATVVLWPETLSTQEAKQKLRESGASKSKRRDDHAYAACLILEDYLEFGNSVN
jgi:putative transcription antitermination factor YqgF